jgi:hypothetical protein
MLYSLERVVDDVLTNAMVFEIDKSTLMTLLSMTLSPNLQGAHTRLP